VYADEPSPLVRQAEAFLDAMESRAEARNPPGDALLDVRIAEAISVSARERRSILLDDGAAPAGTAARALSDIRD